MYLSWIIPSYKEEKRIEKTLREADAYLRAKNFEGGYEIIVVDSSSPDRTGEIVENLKAEIAHLSLQNVRNFGKGFAVKQGMLHARGEIRLFSDADNSTKPEYFDTMIPFFEKGVDVVISSRHPWDARGAEQEVSESWIRRLAGILGNLIIQAFAVPGIWDTQNGFKAFRARAAEDIFSRLTMHGFSFDIEALALARLRGYSMRIIPVRWIHDEESKVTVKAYIQVLFDVFKIRWNIVRGKYTRG